MQKAMIDNDDHWAPYYRGEKDEVELLKIYSFSDRIRYYWMVSGVRSALEKLLYNLNRTKIPESMVSHYFSEQQFGNLNTTADQLCDDHIDL